jgi:tetrahydromethanopterin S-methyltransferase subunit E
MHEWYDKMTSYLAYLLSAIGMVFGSISLEQWYFVSSMLIGLITVALNVWHKRKIQQIAREQGVFRSEQVDYEQNQ